MKSLSMKDANKVLYTEDARRIFSSVQAMAEKTLGIDKDTFCRLIAQVDNLNTTRDAIRDIIETHALAIARSNKNQAIPMILLLYYGFKVAQAAANNIRTEDFTSGEIDELNTLIKENGLENGVKIIKRADQSTDPSVN